MNVIALDQEWGDSNKKDSEKFTSTRRKTGKIIQAGYEIRDALFFRGVTYPNEKGVQAWLYVTRYLYFVYSHQKHPDINSAWFSFRVYTGRKPTDWLFHIEVRATWLGKIVSRQIEKLEDRLSAKETRK